MSSESSVLSRRQHTCSIVKSCCCAAVGCFADKTGRRSLFRQTKNFQSLWRNAGEPHQQVFQRLRCTRSCSNRKKRREVLASAVRQRYTDQGAVLLNILFSPHLPRLSLLHDGRVDRCSFSTVESSVRNLWQHRASQLASARA